MKLGMGWCRLLPLCCLLALALVAKSAEVVVTLVSERDGKAVSLAEQQALWESPFGGWVLTTWPFGCLVDEQGVLGFRTRRQRLMDETSGLGPDGKSGAEVATDLAGGAKKEIDLTLRAAFEFVRPAQITLDLPAGDHVVQPGKLRFTVGADGKVATTDQRLRARGNVLEVRCHPVTFRAYAGDALTSYPFTIGWGKLDLLAGAGAVIEEYRDTASGKGKRPGGEARVEFRQLTLYLPAADYRIAEQPFSVAPDGTVTVTPHPRLRTPGPRRLDLVLPATATAPPQLVGVRWYGARPGLALSTAGADSAPAIGEAGSASLSFGKDGPVVSLGDPKSRSARTAGLPPALAAWPYKVVIFDEERPAQWGFATAQFAVSAGANFSCRLQPLGGGAGPATWNGRLERLDGTAEPLPLVLTADREGVLSGQLPATLTAGAWQLVAATVPRAGLPLALLLSTAEPAPTTVTLYSYRNRGVFRRGDPVDLRCTRRGPAGGRCQVVLSGPGLNRELVELDLGGPGPVVTASVTLATTALAPGSYRVDARMAGASSYPTTFRVCQRESKTDFELYSHEPFAGVTLNAGTPLTAWYGNTFGDPPPELAALTSTVQGGLDGAFGIYAAARGGPAGEACAPVPGDEATLMAMALFGAKAVPSMPVVLHHEDWNPKHSLPEELLSLRRRNALFTQKYADLSSFSGIRLNWYATLNGYWEESEPLDGHQGARNRAAGEWVAARAAAAVEAAKPQNADPAYLKQVGDEARFEATSLILPTAYGQYLADATVIRPGLTGHTGIPSFWLGGGSSYPPLAYQTLTHRDFVDYTDYGRSPWGEFRAPAFLGMGNLGRQRTQGCYMTYGRHARFEVAFGAAGRGLDGFALNPEDPYSVGDDAALLRMFERFGSYFTALDPLPDVAVYMSPISAWANQRSVVLHDLARLRRPGMLLSREDVRAGRLKAHNVLFLAAVPDNEPPDVLTSFRDFAAAGGLIIKDRYCGKQLPGKDLGFAYDQQHVHSGWGLAYPNGEWEFAHLWQNFLQHREAPLLEAFKGARPLPVTTNDREVLISPLAGTESICCFVINMTYVPMSVEGKWRQHAALPRRAELRVAPGWYVRDLLTGKACTPRASDQGGIVDLEFTRAEGRLYLLLKREPQGLQVKAERVAPATLRLSAWLTDAANQPLPDPLPYTVTLATPEGVECFRKYAAVGPAHPLDVPLPAVGERPLTLTVRDLATGRVATLAVPPAPPTAVTATTGVEMVGEDALRGFFRQRRGPVHILLDERQGAYREAANQLAALLTRHGRTAQVQEYDTTATRFVPLRWKWLPEEEQILGRVHKGEAIGWRYDLAPYKAEYDRPDCGYAEYGPRTWLDGDVVLLGRPEDSVALADLAPYLRRLPTPDYPSPGRFFLHYVWSPFLGGCDGVYIGCADPAGAGAAAAFLAQWLPQPPAAAPVAAAGAPLTAAGGPPAPLEDLLAGQLGTRLLGLSYAPSGQRLFVTADSYGDSFFVLDPTGNIVSQRAIQNRCGNNIWWRGGGALRAVDDDQVTVNLWGTEFLLSVTKGFLSQSTSPPSGLPGRIRVRGAGPTLWTDAEHGRTFLGGLRYIQALDATGRLLWTYDDTQYRTGVEDLLYRRSLFLRAVSADGQLLLAAGFGVEQDCYGIGTACNASVFCLETATGKRRWEQRGLYLNEGKALTADDRFVIVDDQGSFHIITAATGKSAGTFRAVAGTDWILAVPGSPALLIVENTHFDAGGPTNRTYLREPGDRPDVVLDLAGRITDVKLTPDHRRIMLCSERGTTAAFGLDGRRQWQTATARGGLLSVSPDGRQVAVGSREGTLYFLGAEDGAIQRQLDFNQYNLTSGEQFVRQLSNLGNVPTARAAQAPPPPPDPPYAQSLAKEAVTVGTSLVTPEQLLAALPKAAVPEGDPARPAVLGRLTQQVRFPLTTTPNTTYLVEVLAAAAEPAKLTAQTRLEVAVETAEAGPNLPLVARLPLSSLLTRRRVAFRTDRQKAVTIAFRVIVPGQEGEGKQARPTYAKAVTSELPALLGDVVVAPLKFASRNFIFEGGAHAKAHALGTVKCEVKPWTGGNSTIRWMPFDAPRAALRMADGVIANQPSDWNDIKDCSTGSSIHHASANVKFDHPLMLTAVAVYEDPSGPVLAGDGVQERVAPNYAIFARPRGASDFVRIGAAIGNTNLVNIFTPKPMEVEELRYVWAGREWIGQTDGSVRLIELEVYSTGDTDISVEDALPDGGDGLGDP